MAYNCLGYAFDALQGLFHSGLTVSAHHSFDFHSLCHSTLLLFLFMISMTFIMWSALFFLLIFRRVVHLKQIQAQGIGYDTEAGKAHGCRAEHRV